MLRGRRLPLAVLVTDYHAYYFGSEIHCPIPFGEFQDTGGREYNISTNRQHIRNSERVCDDDSSESYIKSWWGSPGPCFPCPMAGTFRSVTNPGPGALLSVDYDPYREGYGGCFSYGGRHVGDPPSDRCARIIAS